MASTEYVRLKNMLMADKSNTPNKFNDVLKCDLFIVLKNYFEIAPEDVVLETESDERGFFVKMLAKAGGIKRLGGLPESNG